MDFTIQGHRNVLTILVLTLFAALTADSAVAQVTVAPFRIIVSDRTRTTELTIGNKSLASLEVSVVFDHTFFRSDSLGIMTLDTSAPRTDAERAKIATAWLKIYPRKFTLPAGETRVVRLQASIPSGTEDGEYWARMTFISEPTEKPKPVVNDTATTVTAELAIKIAVGVPVNVRKGKVETGIAVDSVLGSIGAEGTQLILDVHRLGNGAYRGRATVVVTTDDGTQVASGEDEFTAEFNLRRLVPLMKVIPDGSYTVTVTFETKRKGSVSETIIPASPVTQQYRMLIAKSNIALTPISN